MDLKSPFASRSLMISSITPSPTCLMEAKPNLILSPSGVNDASEWLMSGGRTFIPFLRASSIYN